MLRSGCRVFLLHGDPVLRLRLSRLDQRGTRLVELRTWCDLLERLGAASHGDLAVVDPYFGAARGDGLATELIELRRAFPSATVIAAVHPERAALRDILRLGELGVAELIDLETEDTLIAVVRRLEATRGRPLRELLVGQVGLQLPGRARVILGAAIEIAEQGGQPATLAKELRLSPATLVRWLAAAGLPSPRRLLMWLRVLLAASQLDDPGRSVLDVAMSSGYANDRTLRRAMAFTVGLAPRELRRRGAFAHALTAFRSALGAGVLAEAD